MVVNDLLNSAGDLLSTPLLPYSPTPLRVSTHALPYYPLQYSPTTLSSIPLLPYSPTQVFNVSTPLLPYSPTPALDAVARVQQRGSKWATGAVFVL
jgi:hypothetical protein